VPLGELAIGALAGAARFVAAVLGEIVLGIVVQGTGHVLLRLVRPRSAPGETACTVAGLAFWVAVAAGALWLWRRTGG